jgi:peptide/nickel transport system ATP-binding protein
VFSAPGHPYTWGLLASSPRLDRPLGGRLPSIPGSPPSPFAIPGGCAFHPRCAYCERTDGRSSTELPRLERVGEGHEVACHLTPRQRTEIFSTEVVEQL